MTNAKLNDKGELIIIPSATSTSADFDFLVGEHTVHHKKLKSRLANSNEWIEFDGTHKQELILTGIGNLEQHKMVASDGKPVEGMALRLFNPETKLWSIYWADSRSGSIDVPMIGSFEDKIGHFYAKDVFNGKPVLVHFLWNASNPDEPVWSQAFSADGGQTWEWNWYMYFKKTTGNTLVNNDPNKIGVIELRNYLLKKGMRDKFGSYFETNFISSQEERKGYPLGQYNLKGNDDHFFWIRGFQDMKSRSAFLPSFYFSDYWKNHRSAANAMIANNDNVHLLHPLEWKNDTLIATAAIDKNKLYPNQGIAVIDFYIANNKLSQLKQFFGKTYIPLLKSCGIADFTIWESELTENDFPALPVFQDKNLLVVITFYKDEKAYAEKMNLVKSKTNEQLEADLLDAVTLKNTLIVYPTAFTQNKVK